MEYLFSKCKLDAVGQVTIPAWAVDRWRGQMSMRYSELTLKEQDSDRTEADKFILLITEALMKRMLRRLKRLFH